MRLLNLLLAVMAAVTVTVAMRVVGLLLVSALMVVPVAAAQLLTRSFLATQMLAIGLGVLVSLGGVATSYQADVPPGSAIVLLAIAVFAVFSVLAAPLARRRHRGTGTPDTDLREDSTTDIGTDVGTDGDASARPTIPGPAKAAAPHDPVGSARLAQ